MVDILGEPKYDKFGRIEVSQHSHFDQSTLHFDFLVTTSINFTLIDISNIDNYPHIHKGYIHLEWMRIQVDAAAAANYELEFGFLENVDDVNSDLYIFDHIKGSQQTGKDKEIFLNFAPNGGRLRSQSHVTHDVRLNDTTFRSNLNQRTTLDPSTADTPSGNGDIVLLNTVTGGQYDLVVNIGYHSHV
jgi:hypothetical protein